jgi:peptide/nickel transport system substrate-binding protein
MVVTIFDGSYRDAYMPDATGVWSVSASWEGDSLFSGASSSSKTFTVIKKSGCLIATATYGSELSPQVQFLRRFRDNKVLTTFAGSNFMTVFNSFYYSFSPYVASIISGNENLRGILKVILYPLMGVLQLSSTVFSLFSFLPEFGVVLAGIVASTLIAVVYILPCVLLLYLLKKFKLSARSIRWMSLVWVGSLMSIALAEATSSSLLMMVSAGTCVLTTMCLTTLALTRKITKPFFL